MVCKLGGNSANGTLGGNSANQVSARVNAKAAAGTCRTHFASIPYFLVLPGSEFSMTEITQYKYVRPLKHRRKFRY